MEKKRNIFTDNRSSLETHEDERGVIADIFYKENIHHAAFIESKPNIIRGNHYREIRSSISSSMFEKREGRAVWKSTAFAKRNAHFDSLQSWMKFSVQMTSGYSDRRQFGTFHRTCLKTSK